VTNRRLLARALQATLLAGGRVGHLPRLAPELARLSWADVSRWRPAPLPLLASFTLLLGVYVACTRCSGADHAGPGDRAAVARTTLRVYFLASLGRYLPGKVWQLAGLAVLAGRAGLPPGQATAAAVLGSSAS
jgi:hypothetical protein